MNLDQRVELELLSESDELFQFAWLKHGDDKQNGACARSPRLIDLKRLPDEILSKNGQRRSGSNFFDPAKIALKKILLGDDRYRACAGARVAAGQLRGVKTFLEHTLRWRRLLHLRDHADTLRRFERLPERRNRFRRFRHSLHDGFRHTHPRNLKTLSFGLDDSRQNVCPVELFHKNSLSCCNFFIALPLSLASAAIRNPSFQVFAAPPAT